MYQPKLRKDIRCPLEYGLEIFGGKWNSRVICVLSQKGVARYGELRREMSNITDPVLSATLKALQGFGMVERRQYDEIPPRVEYRLTQRGESVLPILHSICDWAGAVGRDGGGEGVPRCRGCDHKD